MCRSYTLFVDLNCVFSMKTCYSLDFAHCNLPRFWLQLKYKDPTLQNKHVSKKTNELFTCYQSGLHGDRLERKRECLYTYRMCMYMPSQKFSVAWRGYCFCGGNSPHKKYRLPTVSRVELILSVSVEMRHKWHLKTCSTRGFPLREDWVKQPYFTQS